MSNTALVALLAFSADWIATLANQVTFAVQKLAHKDEEKKK